MFEGMQDQFHQFLAAAAAASSTAPIRVGPPTHHQHHHPNPLPLPLPLPPPLSFSLLHGCTSPPPQQVYDSYPPHPQPSTQQQQQQQQQTFMHRQWPPAASHHCNKVHHLRGVVKQEGEGETTATATATGFLSTSLVLDRETSMAPSDFIDSAAWSHDELLALLRIRSAVENWFPEFTWEHVSRKLSEMGFKRSPQKCKEKFEEESRSYFQPTTATTTTTIATANEVSCPTKINSYRLFSELEELCHHGHDPPSPPPRHRHHYNHHNHMIQQPPALIPDDDDDDDHGSHENQINDAILDKQTPQREEKEQRVILSGDDDHQQEQMGSEEIRQEKRFLEETDGSEATRDDDQHVHQISIDDNKIDHDEVEGEQLQIAKSERKKRRSLNHHHHQSVNSKKKFEIFKSFCEEIVNKMMSQQEELHNKILQDMTRRDEEMITREEAWKKQEMERINLEMEARAKDLALVGERQAKLIEFLKKFSNFSTNNDNDNDHNNNNDNDDEAAKSAHQNPSSSATHSSSNEESISQTSTPAPNTNKIQPNFHKPRPNKRPRVDNITTQDNDTAGKRWPREEVLALINIRCNVDLNTKTGPDDCDQNRSNSNNNSNSSNKNAPLWERISQKMIELGYNRSAKRCKEKWENINKYFRKTKDMNKNRSIDSRTCPYFHQLNHLYNQGRRGGSGGGSASGNGGASGAGGGAAMAVDVSDQDEVVVRGAQVTISASDRS